MSARKSLNYFDRKKLVKKTSGKSYGTVRNFLGHIKFPIMLRQETMGENFGAGENSLASLLC